MSKSYYNYSVCDPENNQNLQTSIIKELSEKPLAISLNMLQGQPLTTREIFYDYNIASKIAEIKNISYEEVVSKTGHAVMSKFDL